jgi:hypothetical protein
MTAQYRFIKTPLDFMYNYADSPSFKTVDRLSFDEIVDIEDRDITEFNKLVAQGMSIGGQI